MIKAEALPQFLSWFPDMPFDACAACARLWLMTEDLPRPENRIELKPDGMCCADDQPNERRGPPAPTTQA